MSSSAFNISTQPPLAAGVARMLDWTGTSDSLAYRLHMTLAPSLRPEEIFRRLDPAAPLDATLDALYREMRMTSRLVVKDPRNDPPDEPRLQAMRAAGRAKDYRPPFGVSKIAIENGDMARCLVNDADLDFRARQNTLPPMRPAPANFHPMTWNRAIAHPSASLSQEFSWFAYRHPAADRSALRCTLTFTDPDQRKFLETQWRLRTAQGISGLGQELQDLVMRGVRHRFEASAVLYRKQDGDTMMREYFINGPRGEPCRLVYENGRLNGKSSGWTAQEGSFRPFLETSLDELGGLPALAGSTASATGFGFLRAWHDSWTGGIPAVRAAEPQMKLQLKP